MKRSALAAALLMLSPGLRSARGWEDPPPLTPPALEPPAESPASSSPSPAPSPSPSPVVEANPSRPLLVIPGITAPAAPRGARKPTAAPPLDGPRLSDDGGNHPRITLSLPLEPIPPDDGIAPKEEKPVPEREVEPSAKPEPSPAPHRPLGLFEKLWGTEAASQDGITIEPHSDPAVEAAVKRRVEKQIVESLGDRVRDVEVRVKGRDILIRARASHFWLRRTARRTLDALPLPAGYRGRVEMD